MVRAAIIGCGAAGLVLASALAIRGFVATLFCLRDEDVVAIMRSDGVVRVYGLGESSVKVSAAHVSFLRKGYDMVVYATRLNSLRELVDAIYKKLPNSAHVFIQPSIDVLDIAKQLSGDWGFVALYTCLRRMESGVAEWPGEGFVEAWGRSELVDYLAEGLKALGLNVSRRESADQLAWDYWAANLSSQPVAAILGAPLSKIKRISYARSLVDQLWREAELVAREYNVRLRKELLERLLSIRGCVPRMLQDIEQRIGTEIDYINGALLRRALGKGVYVPYNDAVYLLVKALEEEMRSS